MFDSLQALLVGEGKIQLRHVLEHEFVHQLSNKPVLGKRGSIVFSALMQTEASSTNFGAAFRLSRLRNEHIHVSVDNGCFNLHLAKQLVLPWLIACGPTDMLHSPMGDQLEAILTKVRRTM